MTAEVSPRHAWRSGQRGRTTKEKGMTLAGLLATLAAAIFRVILPSTLGPENSLTAYDVAGPNSLACAAIWWPIGFALAAAYFVFNSRRYAGKVGVRRDNQGFYQARTATGPANFARERSSFRR